MHITSVLSFTHKHTREKGPTEVPGQISCSKQDYCQHETAACQAFKISRERVLVASLKSHFHVQSPGEKGLLNAQPSIQLSVLHCLALLGGTWLSAPALQILTRFLELLKKSLEDLELLNSSLSSHFPD